MDLQLAGSAVLVTGGSRGIGAAIAERLLAEGARVLVCARSGDELARRWADTPAQRLQWRVADVTEPGRGAELVDACLAAFGRLDGLVVNAGAGARGGVLDTSGETWRSQFDVKVMSLLDAVTAARPVLARSPHGSVVVINGVTAHAPEDDLVAVGAARAAVANLTVSLTRRLAEDGTRINLVNPGPILTDRHRDRHAEQGSGQSPEQWSRAEAVRRGVPLGRMGTPDEVAVMAVALLSPLAGFVTGSSIDVAGGLGARP